MPFALQIKYIRVAEDVRAIDHTTRYTHDAFERTIGDTLTDAIVLTTIRSLTLQKRRNKRRGNGEKDNHIEEGGRTAVEGVEVRLGFKPTIFPYYNRHTDYRIVRL